MSLHQDWIGFIFEQRSDVWISERSGIPRSTIGFVRRGERDLPAQYRTALRSVYQSETVGRMDRSGMPHRESIRFSIKAPDWQRDTVLRMNRIVSDFAIGSTSAAAAREGWEWDDPRWNTFYDDMSEKIREGIRRTPQPWDAIKEGDVSPKYTRA